MAKSSTASPSDKLQNDFVHPFIAMETVATWLSKYHLSKMSLYSINL